ncbi:MAG: riboflavin synthase [Oligoflexia bacterium]|nr:riboflavin synthase [Oligoflexia bacterium]
MFTGLVKSTQNILKKEKVEGGYNFIVQKPESWVDLEIGESICINGICLTLEEFTQDAMKFFVGLETLSKTDFLYLKPQDLVNLERSLTLQTRLGGHLVSGHVDGVGLVTELIHQGDCLKLKVRLNDDLLKWVVKKGSICVSGVSLTVNEIENNEVEVFLIPETLKQTNLSKLTLGAAVNIECDQLVKVVVEKFKDIYEHSLRAH